jgi:predicted nucleic acid-binding protein
VDTSAIIALEESADDNHVAAREFLEALRGVRLRRVVTNFIFDEAYTWFARDHARRVRVGRALFENPHVRYEYVLPDDERRAWQLGQRLADKPFSFTDLTSFTVMERLGMHKVFTFDRHFRQYGDLEVLPG